MQAPTRRRWVPVSHIAVTASTYSQGAAITSAFGTLPFSLTPLATGFFFYRRRAADATTRRLRSRPALGVGERAQAQCSELPRAREAALSWLLQRVFQQWRRSVRLVSTRSRCRCPCRAPKGSVSFSRFIVWQTLYYILFVPPGWGERGRRRLTSFPISHCLSSPLK